MTEQVEQIVTPVGRLVSGSASEANKVTDPQTGQPKLDAQGQQLTDYYIGVAIPKTGEGHWAETEWGKVLWAIGHMGFPGGQAQSRPDFAWKVIDGDSNVPNQKNIAPNTREGYPGNWVASFKTNFIPQLKNHDGSQSIAGSEFYRGCFVQVCSSVKANGSQQSPGIYLNQQIIALSGHGERISTGPDAATVGFGQAPAPQGMSQAPLAQNVAANVPQQPGVGGQPQYAPPTQPVPAGVPAPVGAVHAVPVAPPSQQAPATAPNVVASPSNSYPQVMTPPAPPGR